MLMTMWKSRAVIGMAERPLTGGAASVEVILPTIELPNVLTCASERIGATVDDVIGIYRCAFVRGCRLDGQSR